MKRSTLSLLNSSLSLTTMIITYILSFVYRTVLVKVMGIEYVGITGLCSNVIQLFALAELGISWAISYHLYKPLQQNDLRTVAAIINLLRKLYTYIGIFIAIAGISILPFLTTIIKSETPIDNLHLIYLMFLANTVISYLFFAYYGILYAADRKNYMLFKTKTIIPVLCTIAQILIIYFLHNFLLAVTMICISSLFQNLWIAWMGMKQYPYLSTYRKESLGSELKKKVINYIKATVLYKVSLTIQRSSTSVIISSFIGVAVLGIYSNFILIVDTVKGVLLNMINPMTAIIGEINAAETTKYKLEIFHRLNFMMEWLCCFCSTCFFILLNPFVELWIGVDCLLPQSTIFLIVIFFYLEFITAFSTKFRDACGLNHIGKYRPLLTAVLNVVISLALVNKIGLNGVLLAMSVSRITTITWFEPWVVYKNVFHSSVLYYYREVGFNIILTLLIIGGLYAFRLYFWDGTIGAFILLLLVCMLIPNAILLLCYHRSDSYKYYKLFILNKIKK